MRGLTGGIATGKSTVSKMLQELGAVVIDADQISRDVVAPGEQGWHQVQASFPEVILGSGELDRKKLGKIIFNDSQARATLNSIIHPLVIAEIKRLGADYSGNGKIVFADIPLLYETKSEAWLKEVWLVYVPLEIQIARLMERDRIDRTEALKRINAQISIETKFKLADKVIDNSQSLAATRAQINKFWHEIK